MRGPTVIRIESRRGDKVRLFVRIPGKMNMWVLTDSSVAFCACPQCESPINVPCKGARSGYTGTTHYGRRMNANMTRRKLQPKASTYAKTEELVKLVKREEEK